jgi:hypothetical protein
MTTAMHAAPNIAGVTIFVNDLFEEMQDPRATNEIIIGARLSEWRASLIRSIYAFLQREMAKS